MLNPQPIYWKVEEKPQAGYFHVETVRGTIICRVPNYDDAVLIAAAPKLLEASEEVIATWEQGDLAAAVRALSKAVAAVKGG